MSIQLPEQLHFDPFHESGVVITRTPDRVVMQLPRESWLRYLPQYVIGIACSCGCVFALFGSLVHLSWGYFGISAFLGLCGAGLLFMTVYGRSATTRIELTTENILEVSAGMGRDSTRISMQWAEITGVEIVGMGSTGNSYQALRMELKDEKRSHILAGRTVGELERFEGLLKSLMASQSLPEVGSGGFAAEPA
jgi:hypothetical protein